MIVGLDESIYVLSRVQIDYDSYSSRLRSFNCEIYVELSQKVGVGFVQWKLSNLAYQIWFLI